MMSSLDHGEVEKDECSAFHGVVVQEMVPERRVETKSCTFDLSDLEVVFYTMPMVTVAGQACRPTSAPHGSQAAESPCLVLTASFKNCTITEHRAYLKESFQGGYGPGGRL
ncbi:unnamed protein product [Phytophthora fragariaefolia]|uniref:Unnamed protein product n=1 Tax=Phytophthora fragariaefolia TaxID=1490495 RepID=A0A9W6Y6S7_9STRA|nr:unnamed protein product [Phytophthora fragariaefolia]